MTTISKRSVVIAGHSTSVSLEPEFWEGLKAMSTQRGVSLASLIAEIDNKRTNPTLSSALRLAVLGYYREKAISSSGQN
jgi:predicted DNA-binding ribbon-helix-helix protein